MDRSRLLGFDQVPALRDGSLARPDVRLTKIGQKRAPMVEPLADGRSRSDVKDAPAR